MITCNSLRLFLITVLLTACSSSNTSLPKKLVLLQTSDEHSFLLGVGPESDDYYQRTSPGTAPRIGGIGRRKTVLDKERAAARAAGSGVLTVSSGDNMMGTLFHTGGSRLGSDYRAMYAMGYDIGSFGNHDFELGPEYLAAVIKTAVDKNAMIPIVSSNIRFSDKAGDAALKAFFDESGADATKPLHRRMVLTTSNGLRVGFIGIMGKSAAKDAPDKTPTTFSLPASGNENDASIINGNNVVMAKIYEDTQAQVDYLRNTAAADVVVLLGHTGTDLNSPEIGESHQIALNVTGIDVILSGHTHLKTEAYTVTNPVSNKPVIIQEPGRYGSHVGKLTIDVLPSGGVIIDRAGTAMLPVNSSISADSAMRPFIDEVIDAQERDDEVTGSGKSMLERTLSAIEGVPVGRTATRGDLYFRTIGNTTFDLPISLRKETGMLRLVSDAMLSAAETISGPTTVALTASAIVRDGIYKGETGAVSFADIFRALPMGKATAATAGIFTPGNPLVRFACTAVELKIILEAAASTSYSSMEAADNFMFPSGLKFFYDTDRTAMKVQPDGDPTLPDNGRVTKITLAANHANIDSSYTTTIFDLTITPNPWLVAPTTLYTIVTDYHLAQFAGNSGITLRNPANGVPFTSPAAAVIRHADGSEYKDYEALAHYIAVINGGVLPSRYNDNDPVGAGPKRAICSGQLCNQERGVPNKEISQPWKSPNEMSRE
jgi:2',3'-cyclic-nucleotide 2'-phosphodiesterase (5'-nucleotidase family)